MKTINAKKGTAELKGYWEILCSCGCGFWVHGTEAPIIHCDSCNKNSIIIYGNYPLTAGK